MKADMEIAEQQRCKAEHQRKNLSSLVPNKDHLKTMQPETGEYISLHEHVRLQQRKKSTPEYEKLTPLKLPQISPTSKNYLSPLNGIASALVKQPRGAISNRAGDPLDQQQDQLWGALIRDDVRRLEKEKQLRSE